MSNHPCLRYFIAHRTTDGIELSVSGASRGSGPLGLREQGTVTKSTLRSLEKPEASTIEGENRNRAIVFATNRPTDGATGTTLFGHLTPSPASTGFVWES